jgi:hypothetical protein
MPMTRLSITEDRAREINKAKDLSGYTHEELRLADEWIKRWALRALDARMHGVPKIIREYAMLMARCHYGSMETDALLMALKCYPEWINEREA